MEFKPKLKSGVGTMGIEHMEKQFVADSYFHKQVYNFWN